MALQADCTMGIIKMLRGERGFGAEVLLQKKAILKTAPVQVRNIYEFFILLYESIIWFLIL